ncbi:MAG: hypothetical protein KKD59_07045 [Acidobacteria bacterium]|nr:hypothetical protein [Acidobacteriota bacterium]
MNLSVPVDMDSVGEFGDGQRIFPNAASAFIHGDLKVFQFGIDRQNGRRFFGDDNGLTVGVRFFPRALGKNTAESDGCQPCFTGRFP